MICCAGSVDVAVREPDVEVEEQARGDDQRENVEDGDQDEADNASRPRGSRGTRARNPGPRNEAVSQCRILRPARPPHQRLDMRSNGPWGQ